MAGMPGKAGKVIYHVILIKTKPGTTQEQISEWSAIAKANVGVIPGLLASRIGVPEAPLPTDRSKGYDIGVVLVFDGPENVAKFGSNPDHQLSARLSREWSEDRIVLDFYDDPLHIQI